MHTAPKILLTAHRKLHTEKKNIEHKKIYCSPIILNIERREEEEKKKKKYYGAQFHAF